MIDAALAETLGSEAALAALLEAALAESDVRARRQAREAERRLVELDTRRARVQEGYEAGIMLRARQRSGSLISTESGPPCATLVPIRQ